MPSATITSGVLDNRAQGVQPHQPSASFAQGLRTVASSAALPVAPNRVDRYSRLPRSSVDSLAPLAVVAQPLPGQPPAMVTVSPPTATTVESSDPVATIIAQAMAPGVPPERKAVLLHYATMLAKRLSKD